MNHSFLLVGEAKSRWATILGQALSSLGPLRVVPEQQATLAIVQSHFDVIIVGAGSVFDPALLASRLRAQKPEARVVVATASPTWKQAREAMLAGAVDYTQKSLDEKELCRKIQAVLELPVPPWPR